MILLVSGGMDSYIAWHYLGKPPVLYVKLNNKAVKYESKAVKRIYDNVQYFNLDLSKFEQIDFFIPNRNLLLLAIGSLYSNEVAIVCQKWEQQIGDRSPEFFDQLEKILRLTSNNAISIMNIFADKSKSEMVAWYKSKDLDLRILTDQTYSCYTGRKIHCGVCTACFRRWVALTNNDLTQRWETDPKTTYTADLYKKRALNSYYELGRCKEILTALEK